MHLSLLAYLTRIILLSSVAATMVLFFVITLKPNKKISNYILAIMLISLAGWSVGIFSMLVFNKPWATTLTFFSPALAVLGQLWFTKIFPQNKLPKNWLEYWSILPMLFILALTFFPDLIFKNVRIIESYYVKGDNSSFGTLYSSIITIYTISALFLLIKKLFRKSVYDYVTKTQIKYLTFGFATFFFISMLTNSVLPVFFGVYFFNAIGPVFLLLLVGFIVFIISKYRFLDIRLIIQRSLIYSVLLFLITGFYLFLVFILGDIFERTTRTTIFLSAGLTAIAGIYGSRPIEKYFSKLTDRFFFKDRYNFPHAIHQLSEILNINIELPGLLKKMSNQIKEILKIKKLEIVLLKEQNILFYGRKIKPIAGIYPGEITEGIKDYSETILVQEIPFIVEDEKKKIKPGEAAFLFDLKIFCDKNNFSAVTPVVLETKVMAALFLGEKFSGEQFTAEDLELLKTFSYQAAVALEKSRLYEAEKNYAAKLEEKVRQRTEKIQKLQEEQRQMMIDISHGLQTPLTIIKGEAEFLQGRLPNDANVKNFEKSIDQISGFIYSMLNLARLETTEEDFRKDKINLSELLEEMTESFDVLVQEKGIKIIKNIEPGVIILGKKDKLEEMMNNLVSNSVKYIDNEKKITITLQKNKDDAALIIEDTGIGIKKEHLEKIFNRFYRVKDGRHSGIQGTGIGLAIVKKIVEKHGGTIRADSEEGKWTRMMVEFKTA